MIDSILIFWEIFLFSNGIFPFPISNIFPLPFLLAMKSQIGICLVLLALTFTVESGFLSSFYGNNWYESSTYFMNWYWENISFSFGSSFSSFFTSFTSFFTSFTSFDSSFDSFSPMSFTPITNGKFPVIVI